MKDNQISFSIQGDVEGYITFEWPFCGSEFKLRSGEIQDENHPFDDLFYPYCGLTKQKDYFYSKDVVKKIEALATNYLIENINKAFGNMKKSFNRSNSVIKIEYKPLRKVNIPEISEKDTAEMIFKCPCARHFKVLYCARCDSHFNKYYKCK